ncbi:transient receptor potential cation channel subfamily A member 1 homolog [Homarus americanus]|uniref:transient receptor potential cation channel subfamily A member 1 homolog n=1 Tax=Homarus americanus TaxID=6706 RepID=UPI001C47703D|nr:transient receptor potential cation channel subfamily A member 1 homolog [Homarus americanus]
MACDSSSERDTCERPDSNSSDPNYQCEASSDFRIPGGMLEENFTHVLLRKFTLLLLLVCFAVKRGKNLHCRGMYLRVEKILRLLCFTTTLTLLVDWTDCTAATGVREDWQWRCGVCSVLLAWYHFIILLGLLPQFSVYLFIVNDFLKTILKLFGLLLLQVVAFTFAFQMLMRGKYAFSKFSRAIMKILTMMVGDLGYEENFGNTESLPYPIMSSLLLLCFLGIMVIGMINIVTNLPQGEMEKAKDQAQLINLSVRVSLIITIESWFPSLRKRYNIGWVIDKVNQDISQDTELNSNATINKSCSNLNSSCHLCGGRDPEHTYRLLENLSRQVNEQNMLLQDLMSCVVRGEKHRIKCNTT